MSLEIMPPVSLCHLPRCPPYTCRKRLSKVEVSPSDRWSNLQKKLTQTHKDPGPCGGFSATYCCMCDYHALPFMEDVAWVSTCLSVSSCHYFHNPGWNIRDVECELNWRYLVFERNHTHSSYCWFMLMCDIR